MKLEPEESIRQAVLAAEVHLPKGDAAAEADDGGDDLPPAPPEGGDPERPDDPHLEACTKEPETDIGNARRFLIRHGNDVMALEGLGWAVFDEKRWRNDFFASHVRPIAHGTVEKIADEVFALAMPPADAKAFEDGKAALPRLNALKARVSGLTAEEMAEKLKCESLVDAGREAAKRQEKRRGARHRYAKTSCNSGKIDNMLKEAAVYRSRPVSIMNKEPLAINVDNGTLRIFKHNGAWQLRLEEHRKDDLISKIMQVNYDEAAACSLFLNFLEDILPDDEVREFIQRWFGYCLTGLTSEQVFVFLYGQGRNGKSTLVDIICRIFNDYATTVPFETLAGDDRRKGSEATPDLVQVPGARLVRASEPETGMQFRESMVKSLTSGEPILIRRMREEFFEVYPTFKLILSGNHKPNIKGADDGIWRRVLLIPFDVQIPKEKIDRLLLDKLWAERAGILNWMLQGCLSYLERGLDIPDKVRAATEEYRDQSDAYGAFLKGACEVTLNDWDTATPGELHEAFKKFCQAQGFYAVGPSTFNKAFPDKAAVFGVVKAKSMGLSLYRGIQIKDEFKPSGTQYGGQQA